MTDYTAVDEKHRRDVLDVKVVTGMSKGSDHNAILAKIKIKIYSIFNTCSYDAHLGRDGVYTR